VNTIGDGPPFLTVAKATQRPVLADLALEASLKIAATSLSTTRGRSPNQSGPCPAVYPIEYQIERFLLFSNEPMIRAGNAGLIRFLVVGSVNDNRRQTLRELLGGTEEGAWTHIPDMMHDEDGGLPEEHRNRRSETTLCQGDCTQRIMTRLDAPSESAGHCWLIAPRMMYLMANLLLCVAIFRRRASW